MGEFARQAFAMPVTPSVAPGPAVIAATPIDLAALIGVKQPVVRARYHYKDAGEPRLSDLIDLKLRDCGMV